MAEYTAHGAPVARVHVDTERHGKAIRLTSRSAGKFVFRLPKSGRFHSGGTYVVYREMMPETDDWVGAGKHDPALVRRMVAAMARQRALHGK